MLTPLQKPNQARLVRGWMSDLVDIKLWHLRRLGHTVPFSLTLQGDRRYGTNHDPGEHMVLAKMMSVIYHRQRYKRLAPVFQLDEDSLPSSPLLLHMKVATGHYLSVKQYNPGDSLMRPHVGGLAPASAEESVSLVDDCYTIYCVRRYA